MFTKSCHAPSAARREKFGEFSKCDKTFTKHAQNIGFDKQNGKIYPVYIDLGSATLSYSNEPKGAKVSSYPSTLLYLSNNKVPFDSTSVAYIEDEYDQRDGR